MLLQYFYKYIKAIINTKLFRYAIIGGISTLIHFTISSLFIYFLHTSIYLSNIIAFFIAYIFSYSMQSTFVFGHIIAINKAFKYFIVQFFALIISMFISNVFYYNDYIKTIIIIIIMPFITFSIHKFWTFQES